MSRLILSFISMKDFSQKLKILACIFFFSHLKILTFPKMAKFEPKKGWCMLLKCINNLSNESYHIIMP